ncbi:hypothetical protein DB345_20805 [Spartobacteria bacterium LR76]|nr:hypothetical protein DB345_20805 [Spartobacteria bacterium LR76]
MADVLRTTRSKSWFERISSAIAGVVGGVVLVAIAFGLLSWNEVRAVNRSRTLAIGEKEVVPIASAPIDPANNGRLVHVSGEASASGPATDSVLGTSAKALCLRRTVEMYQWKEESSTEREQKVGGSEEETTTYTYKKVWSSEPIDSSGFQEKSHQNPDSMPIATEDFFPQEVQVGDFFLTDALLSQADKFEKMPVKSENLTATSELERLGNVSIVAGAYYVGADPQKPAVGDLRVAFEVIPLGEVSVLARQVGDTFEPFSVRDLGSIETLYLGAVSAQEMFAGERSANTTLTWILRGVGFVLMFVGLLAISSPLPVIASVLPLAGDVIGAGVALVMFLLALALTVGTIAITWIAVRPLLGIGLLILAALVVAGGGWLLYKRRQGRLLRA